MEPNLITTLGFAMGSAWLSGINLYATVVTLGLLQRYQLVRLPGDLDFMQQWWIIILAGALYLIEFAADKIPVVDSIWDAIHTFIRVPAGAVLAASAFAHFDPAVRLVALLVGGGVALSSHGAKAATRLAANTSPEPFSNIALSLIEDVIAVSASYLMAVHPVVILALVAIFLILSAWLARRIVRALQSLFRSRAAVSRPVVRSMLLLVCILGGVRADSGDDWPVYGHDPGGQRFSPLAAIHRGNVKSLKIAWIYRTGDAYQPKDSRPTAFEATPLHIDSTLYLSTPLGRIIALDPVTGKQRWSYDPKVDRDKGYGDFASRGVSAWRSPQGQLRILLATVDARLIAVDAATGRPIRDFADN